MPEPSPWTPPWEAALGGLGGLALLGAGVTFHLLLAPGEPGVDGLLNEPLAWTLVGATPLFAALGWILGERRREREQAFDAWQRSATAGMRELAQREWLTRGILQTAFDAVLVLDDEERIVDANPNAARIFGHPLDALIGRAVESVLPDHRRLGTTLAITRRTAGGEVLGKEWQTHALHAAGHRFPVDLNMVALREPGLLLYVVREATTRVATERERIQRARAELRDHALSQSRQRGTQLLDLGGALRSELDRVLDQVDSMQARGEGSPELVQAAYGLVLHLERLQALSMWERSLTSTPTLVPVDVPVLVQQVIDALGPLARYHRNRVRLTLDPSVGSLETDALRFATALRSLVANACVWCNDGEVHVDVAREPGRGSDWVAVYVHDTGPGLAPTTLADLFTLLASDPDDLSDAPGSGLGLKLAHRLAKALGGHLAASNTAEGGASFALRVPLQPARAQEAGEPVFERLDSGA